MRTPHVIESIAGSYRTSIASSVGMGSNKRLEAVLDVDETNGWSVYFEVSIHGEVTKLYQLSTAIRRYNEAA